MCSLVSNLVETMYDFALASKTFDTNYTNLHRFDYVFHLADFQSANQTYGLTVHSGLVFLFLYCGNAYT